MASAKTTIDHQTIQRWVEDRGGCPARVKGTGSASDPGILRIDYPGFTGLDTLEKIPWDQFFEAFDDNELAFLFQDEPNSRFSKLISRDRMGEDAGDAGDGSSGRSAPRQHGSGNGAGPDAIQLLESQHREVESLFEQVREADSKRARSELFAELADKLAAHAKIEETIFYPSVCDDDTVELLREAVEEHLGVKRVLADMLELEPDSKEFEAKLQTLEEQVQHHVEEEEQELFVLVREQDLVDAGVLGRKLEQRFNELLESEPREQIPTEIDHAASLPC
jgi:hypothetical protein